jgi:S1-C subfamily serine protease
VIRAGEPYPGQDIAVVQLDSKEELICLRLGDSSVAALPVGSAAMSFGVGDWDGPTVPQKEKAHDLVISVYGTLKPRREIVGTASWQGLETSAAAGSRLSGGPLVNSRGEAVGVSIFGSPGDGMAVPIELVKSMLAQNPAIEVQPGVLTSHWIEGMRYYRDKDYKNALADLEIVDGTKPPPEYRDSWWRWTHPRQVPRDPILGGKMTFRHDNQYVTAKIVECRRGLGLKER